MSEAALIIRPERERARNTAAQEPPARLRFTQRSFGASAWLPWKSS